MMMPMNAYEIPREVSLHPPKNPFQIDESDKVQKKAFPPGYNENTEYS